MQEIFSNLNNKQKIVVLISIIIILAIIIIYFYNKNENTNELIISNDIGEITNAQVEEKIGIANNKEKVIVHVIGEVNSPRSS